MGDSSWTQGSMGVRAALLTALVCVALAANHGPTPTSKATSAPRTLRTVLYDDFSSGKIDPAKWKHASTGFSNNFVIYSPEPANSFVKHNMLYIKPTMTVDHFGADYLEHGVFDAKALWGDCSNLDTGDRGCQLSGSGKIPPVMSAMLMTKVNITYGRVAVRARLSKGDWLWPAIWLLPAERLYGGWPRSGEIDIMESRGNEHYTENYGRHRSKGVDYTHFALHYGTTWNKWHERDVNGEYWLKTGNLADTWHTYWMDWTEDYIKMGIDNVTVMNWATPPEGYFQHGHFNHATDPWVNGTKAAPFDRPFFLILNVAVGGVWFWEENQPYARPWNASSPKDQQQRDFWAARHLWQPTWHGDNIAMRVKSVKMEQYE